MKHVFEIRRGHNGRAIRQHLYGHHNRVGGALTTRSVMSTVMEAPRKVANMVNGRAIVVINEFDRVDTVTSCTCSSEENGERSQMP
jgi:hypothetical protein